MSPRKNSRRKIEYIKLPVAGDLASRLPLLLDMPGLLFVEARKRIDRGTRNLQKLRTQLAKHQQRVSNAASAQEPDEQENAWINVLQGVGSLEPLFGRTISDLAVTDVLLVAAAESYINAIAGQVLPSSDAEQFEKLSPVGKCSFFRKS